MRAGTSSSPISNKKSAMVLSSFCNLFLPDWGEPKKSNRRSFDSLRSLRMTAFVAIDPFDARSITESLARLRCLLQGVGSGHADGQSANAADDADPLGDADSSTRIEQVKQVRALQRQLIS